MDELQNRLAANLRIRRPPLVLNDVLRQWLQDVEGVNLCLLLLTKGFDVDAFLKACGYFEALESVYDPKSEGEA